MKMILKKVGQPAQMVNLLDNLKTYQNYVAGGGLIEVLYLEKDVICIFDEEGKLKNLPLNFIIGDQIAICGDAIFVGDNGAGGNKDISDEQILYVNALFEGRQNSFADWLDGFFEAHPVELVIWTFSRDTSNGAFIRQIDTYSVIASLKVAPEFSWRILKNRLKALIDPDQEKQASNLQNFLHHHAELMFKYNN